jgi:hypothetical protein
MERSASTWQGRLGLWTLYGLAIPVSPIILAAVFTVQEGGTLTAGRLLGQGQLDLAAVGVCASVIALQARAGVRGEFQQIMLGATVLLIVFTGASFGNVVTAIGTRAAVDSNAIAAISGAWLVGAIILGMYVSTLGEDI